MPTYRVRYVDTARSSEDVEANSLDVCDWCAVFVGINGEALKIIHANVIDTIDVKPQTH